MAMGPISTPDRRPGSVRRTTSHDQLRYDGLLGPVTVRALGRDLYTDERGVACELATGHVDCVATFPERTVLALTCSLEDGRVEELVGTSLASGFRRGLEQRLPQRGSDLTYQLLDDLPTAVLVSGVTLHRAGVLPPVPQRRRAPMVDLCAGYVAGGTLQLQVADGQVPEDLPSPPAPELVRDDDPLAWHAFEPMPGHSTRRVRRLDVWRSSEATAGVEAYLRDSHMDENGVETVVHEYVVRAAYDAGSGIFTECEAEYGALPWPECPAALASAGRLVGERPEDLRLHVREAFSGPSTCTHLNDVLRSLEDVPALLGRLKEA